MPKKLNEILRSWIRLQIAEQENFWQCLRKVGKVSVISPYTVDNGSE